MSLKQRLTDDMKAAMKSGDKDTLGVIRLINAAIKQREVDERIELDDAGVIAVLEKGVKQRKDSITQYEAAGREDLAAIERAEMVVIERYLPEKMGEAQILAAIDAAIKQREVDERVELDDAAVLAVLEKMVKQRKDSVNQYEAAGREDLAGIERAEIAVIEHYLPAKLSEAEIVDIVDGAIRDSGATGPADMGKLMGVLKPMLAGQADMGQVSALVKRRLAG